jgi:hypothetical protein
VADEDDFFGDADGETEKTPDSNPVRDLRKHANKLEKDLKAAQAELEPLRQFKAEADQKAKAETVGTIFTKLGLNPAQAKLYELAMPEAEPSEETVGKWAVEYGLATSDESVPDTTGFTPTTTPEGAPPGSKRLTGKEMLEEALRGDPLAAQAAFLKGRVDTSDSRRGLGPER